MGGIKSQAGKKKIESELFRGGNKPLQGRLEKRGTRTREG